MRNIVDPASLISKMWKKWHEWYKSNIFLFSLFLGKPWGIKEFRNPKRIILISSYFVFYTKSFIVLKILLWKSSRKIWLKWHLKLFFCFDLELERNLILVPSLCWVEFPRSTLSPPILCSHQLSYSVFKSSSIEWVPYYQNLSDFFVTTLF